jgi:hypothetical protein
MRYLGRGTAASLVAVAAACAVAASVPSPAWAGSGHQAVVRSVAAKTGFLLPGESLRAGESVRSGNGKYVLIQQADGNLVLRNGAQVVWNTATGGAKGAVTFMQTDGNLVVRRGGRPIWDSHTGNRPGARLAVQDDGNIVLYNEDDVPVWSRHTLISKFLPGQTLKAGDSVSSGNKRFRLIQGADGHLGVYSRTKPLWNTKTQGHDGASTTMQTDGNLVVRDGNGAALWDSETGGHPGAYRAMQDDGNAVVVSRGGKALWSSGTGGH